MTDEPRQGNDSSALPPWERADRWSEERTEVTRVDELVARLGQTDQPRRRRRRADDDDSTAVAVGDLIASITGATAAPTPEPTDDSAATDQAPDAASAGPSASAAAPAPPATSAPVVPVPAPSTAPGQPSAAVVTPTDDPDTAVPVAPVPADGFEAGVEPIAPQHSADSQAQADPAAFVADRPSAVEVRPAGPVTDDADTTVLPPWSTGRPAVTGTSDNAPAFTPDAPTEILPAYAAVGGEPDVSAIRASLNRAAEPVQIDPPVEDMTAPPVRTQPGRRAALYAGRVLVTLLSVLVLAATGMYNVIIARGNAALAANEIDAVAPQDTNIVAPTVAAPSQEATGPMLYAPENILLIGSDTRAGNNGEVGAGGEGAEGESANSDTMMIAHLSADRQRVQVVSIPRDLVVDAPDNCHGWNFRTGEISDSVWEVDPGTTWQINSAYSVGGPQCLVLAVQKFTGIRIDRVIGIDFVGFADMVDALGGITVNVCQRIDDNELGLIVAEGGVQTIGGQQALNLVRARKVPYDEGRSDPARIERQQKVLSAILRQVTDAGTMLNPVTLDSFLQAFARNVQPDNVTLQDMLYLAESLGDLSPGRVTFYSLPTIDSTSREGKLEVDPALGPAVFNAIINDLPLPSDEVQEPIVPETSAPDPAPAPAPTSEPAPVPTTVTVAPGDVDLRIWNMAGRSGVAGDAQAALNDLGFDVTDNDLIRDDDNQQDNTTVVYAEADRATALTVLAAVPGATGVVDNSLPTGEIRLMVGAEFDEVFADSVAVGDPVTDADESTAEQPAPTTPLDAETTAESPIMTSLAPSDIPAVNAGNTDCL